MTLGKVYEDFGDVSFDGTVNYTKFQNEEPKLVGATMQNQHPTANFWVASGRPGRDSQALRIAPGMTVLLDILPGQNSLWGRSDTAGAYLTVIKKYVSGQ